MRIEISFKHQGSEYGKTVETDGKKPEEIMDQLNDVSFFVVETLKKLKAL